MFQGIRDLGKGPCEPYPQECADSLAFPGSWAATQRLCRAPQQSIEDARKGLGHMERGLGPCACVLRQTFLKYCRLLLGRVTAAFKKRTRARIIVTMTPWLSGLSQSPSLFSDISKLLLQHRRSRGGYQVHGTILSRHSHNCLFTAVAVVGKAVRDCVDQFEGG